MVTAMSRIASRLLLCCALASATACEKADEPKGSGALAAADLELFESLPGSSNVLFGGNYMKLQDFMASSALGKFAERSTSQLGPGMKEWMSCFLDLKNVKVAGAVSAANKGAELRMVFSGATVKDLEACAKKASFATAVAPDGKFIAISIPSPAGPQDAGYLTLANGAIYTRQAFALLGSSSPSVTQSTRAELEADIAAIKESAADNKKLQGILAKVDRTKTLWFAGSGEGTPIADKVGELYGSIEIAPGVAVDVSAQLKDESMAKELESGIADAKQSAGKMPAEMRSLIEGIKFKRDGGRIRFAVKVTDAQLETILKQAGPMMGGF